MALEPFAPDDIYCVYCHAPAAGLCASCRAVCCGDCVELSMGLTRPQAICRSCLEKGARAPGAGLRRWIFAVLAAVLLAIAVWLLLAGGQSPFNPGSGARR